jgi:hypothetical protein
MAEARAQLEPGPHTRINRDFAPIAYYENAVLSSGESRPVLAEWLRRAALVPRGWVFASAGLLSLLAFLIARGKKNREKIAMAATGFTLMSAQIFLLLGFQAVCGYLYSELALLLGLMMAGMAVGSAWAMRRKSSVAATQAALALLLPALMAAIRLLANSESNGAAQLLFPALAAAAGALGGAQFSRLAAAGNNEGKNAAALYAADLAGGCLAALLVSAYLIPVFGFWPTAWMVTLVGAGPAIATMRR